MKKNKYEYNRIIQQHYGQGWEDVSSYEANSSFVALDVKLLRADLKEYRLTGYPTRVISRKELAN